ncbi:DUF7521 family protein [Halorientalis litorea]|uniref:DUF7521 family protein n=1 Tax=Halorientalis litorea TaxID=2931977 RepID=UPI001FF38697|nr:hypothetical protein [Halorientalis litorea]
MLESPLLLAVTKVATVLFGGVITCLAFRAYRRTRSSALGALTVGIGFVTVGAVLGGTLHQFTGTTLATSVTVQSVFTAVGFTVLTYSLYTTSRPDQTGTHLPNCPSDE